MRAIDRTLVARAIVSPYLRLRWRRWLTQRYLAHWLDGRGYYRIELQRTVDNADQRIAEDLRFLGEIGVHGERGVLADRLLEIVREVSANPNVDSVSREVWDDVRGILEEQGMSYRRFAVAMETKFCGSTLWNHAPSRDRKSVV